MRVALIWPHGFDRSNVIPLSLGYLKSNIDDSRHEVRLFDCTLMNWKSDSPEFVRRIKEFNPSVVGISNWSPTYHEAIRIFRLIKSIDKNIVTVIGGPHATSYADKTMENAEVDYLFIGESELSFPVFLEEIEKEKPDFSKVLGLCYRSPTMGVVKNEQCLEENLDIIKIPDYDFINLPAYIKNGYRYGAGYRQNAPVWVTRGCPYRCGYCSAPFQNGKPVRAHSIEYMMQWIKFLYHEKGIRKINIVDDNFTFHTKYAKAFCRAVIDLNLADLYFGTPNGIRQERTDFELFQLMKRAGWEYVIIAPESGSPKVLERMHKDLDLATIPPKVKEIKEAGLKVYGFFILGYPGETLKDLAETEKFILDCKFDYAVLSHFQPLPGTPIYDELVDSGEIEDGLLPKPYETGERMYTPVALKNFNFPVFILKVHLKLLCDNPMNIFYHLRINHPKKLLRIGGRMLKNVFYASSRN